MYLRTFFCAFFFKFLKICRKTRANYLWEFCYIAGEIDFIIITQLNLIDKINFVRYINNIAAIFNKTTNNEDTRHRNSER